MYPVAQAVFLSESHADCCLCHSASTQTSLRGHQFHFLDDICCGSPWPLHIYPMTHTLHHQRMWSRALLCPGSSPCVHPHPCAPQAHASVAFSPHSQPTLVAPKRRTPESPPPPPPPPGACATGARGEGCGGFCQGTADLTRRLPSQHPIDVVILQKRPNRCNKEASML